MRGRGKEEEKKCQRIKHRGLFSGSSCPMQWHPGRGAGVAASCDLGGNIYKELSHGVLLEHVRCHAVHTLDQWENV